MFEKFVLLYVMFIEVEIVVYFWGFGLENFEKFIVCGFIRVMGSYERKNDADKFIKWISMVESVVVEVCKGKMMCKELLFWFCDELKKFK